jgi:predicted metal-dependent hydrolase
MGRADAALMGGLPIRRRTSVRARRLSLKLDVASGEIELVIPRGCDARKADRFLASNLNWVTARLAELPPRIPFEPGVELPVLDDWLLVRHDSRASRVPVRRNATLLVGGPRDQVEARVRTWLRETARAELLVRAQRDSRRVGRPIAGLRIADPRTRWGSCSPGGVLSFSWRLVLAPRSVLDYVVAHESAHLRYLSHGPRFWSLVRRLDPDYEDARSWLTHEGAQLHRYG